jgi:uncharacterized membrane protein YfcA
VTPSGGAVALLLAAGVLAGLVGTAGGITSLVSYPALLVAGLSPLSANVANLVALVACWPGSAIASRRELTGTGRWLRPGLPVAALGGVLGAALLLVTPPGEFVRVVPFLVLAGSLTLIAQPWLTARHARSHGESRVVALVLVAVLSVYGGYFGAGSGVMVLTATLVLVDDRLPYANAVKNMLIGGAAVASAGLFIAWGPVDWLAVIPLGIGLFAGSMLGPAVARRVAAAAVRWAAAGLGVALALELWITG